MPSNGRKTLHRLAIIGVLSLLVLTTFSSGCLEEDDPIPDMTDWQVAMTVNKFDTNGVRPVNVTELLFKVNFGSIDKDPWMIHESDGFVKGLDDTIPIRIEARYDDGKNPPDAFAIMGSNNVITGGLVFAEGKMTLEINGNDELYTIDRSSVIGPLYHTEITATITGEYGDLVLYFNLREPS
jgi:hypothetical protein